MGTGAATGFPAGSADRRDGTALNRFLAQAAIGCPLTVHGSNPRGSSGR